jgi:hypothetical protein
MKPSFFVREAELEHIPLQHLLRKDFAALLHELIYYSDSLIVKHCGHFTTSFYRISDV